MARWQQHQPFPSAELLGGWQQGWEAQMNWDAMIPWNKCPFSSSRGTAEEWSPSVHNQHLTGRPKEVLFLWYVVSTRGHMLAVFLSKELFSWLSPCSVLTVLCSFNSSWLIRSLNSLLYPLCQREGKLWKWCWDSLSRERSCSKESDPAESPTLQVKSGQEQFLS